MNKTVCTSSAGTAPSGSSEFNSQSVDLEALQVRLAEKLVPQMLMADRLRGDALRDRLGDGLLSASDHDVFYNLTLGGTADDCLIFVQRIQQRGVSDTVIMLELFAETARRLGTAWEEDEHTFTDITIALCRIHHVLRDQSWRNASFHTYADAPRAVVSTLAGDQHILGITIVSEILRREGWAVTTKTASLEEDLVRHVRSHSVDLVALSATCDFSLEGVAETIRMLRDQSKNPDIKVLVGGAAFQRAPEAVQRIGADEYAAAGTDIHEIAFRLLRQTKVGI